MCLQRVTDLEQNTVVEVHHAVALCDPGQCHAWLPHNPVAGRTTGILREHGCPPPHLALVEKWAGLYRPFRAFTMGWRFGDGPVDGAHRANSECQVCAEWLATDPA